MASPDPPQLGDDAPTPVRGTPIARIRRLSQRFSRKLGPVVRNRRAIWLVVGFCTLMAIALALFLFLVEEPEAMPQPGATGQSP